MYKPFCRQLHEDNDGPAKEAVCEFLLRDWHLLVEEGGTYGVDLLCFLDGLLVGYVEVERRHNWLDEFPFPTVHVPARKAKFLSLDRPMVLFSVRSDLKQALSCRGEDILASPVETKSNKYMPEEEFFLVPLSRWTRVVL